VNTNDIATQVGQFISLAYLRFFGAVRRVEQNPFFQKIDMNMVPLFNEVIRPFHSFSGWLSSLGLHIGETSNGPELEP
jgi:hypothetical protein